ncbi:hypothetical protein L208DRAFT_1377014 [Tricholoma matsutake]|nr:hypothetical protein L208DRAFT_1377014 [Tricholoma matsutake 945]
MSESHTQSVVQEDESVVFTGYISDLSNDGDELEGTNDGDDEADDTHEHTTHAAAMKSTSKASNAAPPLKCHKLDISVLKAHCITHEKYQKELESGLNAIEKLIKSQKCAVFDVGSAEGQRCFGKCGRRPGICSKVGRSYGAELGSEMAEGSRVTNVIEGESHKKLFPDG